MISSILSGVIGWISGLSPMMMIVSVLAVALIGWISVGRLYSWLRVLVMRYALKKTAALGLIGVLGTDYLLPGLDLLDPIMGLIPL